MGSMGGGGVPLRGLAASLVYPGRSPLSAATKSNDGWLTPFCQLTPAVISKHRSLKAYKPKMYTFDHLQMLKDGSCCPNLLG